MECVYVCLLQDLLISLYFNRKFTRKLHCLHQVTPPFFPHLVNTLCLNSFAVSVPYDCLIHHIEDYAILIFVRHAQE